MALSTNNYGIGIESSLSGNENINLRNNSVNINPIGGTIINEQVVKTIVVKKKDDLFEVCSGIGFWLIKYIILHILLDCKSCQTIDIMTKLDDIITTCNFIYCFKKFIYENNFKYCQIYNSVKLYKLHQEELQKLLYETCNGMFDCFCKTTYLKMTPCLWKPNDFMCFLKFNCYRSQLKNNTAMIHNKVFQKMKCSSITACNFLSYDKSQLYNLAFKDDSTYSTLLTIKNNLLRLYKIEDWQRLHTQLKYNVNNQVPKVFDDESSDLSITFFNNNYNPKKIVDITDENINYNIAVNSKSKDETAVVNNIQSNDNNDKKNQNINNYDNSNNVLHETIKHWTCGNCTFKNDMTSKICVECNSSKPIDTGTYFQQSSNNMSPAFDSRYNSTTAIHTFTKQKPFADTINQRFYGNGIINPSSFVSHKHAKLQQQQEGWCCLICMFMNDHCVQHCEACNMPKSSSPLNTIISVMDIEDDDNNENIKNYNQFNQNNIVEMQQPIRKQFQTDVILQSERQLQLEQHHSKNQYEYTDNQMQQYDDFKQLTQHVNGLKYQHDDMKHTIVISDDENATENKFHFGSSKKPFSNPKRNKSVDDKSKPNDDLEYHTTLGCSNKMSESIMPTLEEDFDVKNINDITCIPVQKLKQDFGIDSRNKDVHFMQHDDIIIESSSDEN